MRTAFVIAAAIACPQPALAQHAIFAGSDLSAQAATPAARAVIARAQAALGRPPGAIPKLHTEGTLPGHGIRDVSIAAKADHPIVLDLALAWAITRDRRYLDQAARYLENWADTYQMSFNPIDETSFDMLVLANDLTASDLPRPLAAKLDGFWRRMASGYLDAMDGKPHNAHTNWQSHRIKLATLAAYRTGDTRLIERARAAYRRQVAVNLRPDGSTFDFEERDALHYVTYNLDPLMTAALAARAHGENWFDWKAPSGASLARSVDWLATFARGERTHIEFAHSKIAFDRERAAAGQKEYAPHAWNPVQALNTFALASRFDPRHALLRDTLAQRSGRSPASWMVLIQ
ncbi:alginate lyase family protein [Sphingomonas sp. S2-65]|uniref:alginate lyase family protein n=1 Tax=Sphingomonas sp. S2-65 TaxID=2903960 RepID=UPI001F2F7CF3|nr:alginate lyase family protein [Sphingomonas sp. S2-65]UYY59843.1 alginate lyase family protein [Sphingomonas sp. S2-65]